MADPTMPHFDFEFKKHVNTDVDHTLDATKHVTSTVMVMGQLADAEAFAKVDNPWGDGYAETLTTTWTTPTHVEAYSESISATNGAWLYMA